MTEELLFLPGYNQNLYVRPSRVVAVYDATTVHGASNVMLDNGEAFTVRLAPNQCAAMVAAGVNNAQQAA